MVFPSWMLPGASDPSKSSKECTAVRSVTQQGMQWLAGQGHRPRCATLVAAPSQPEAV